MKIGQQYNYCWLVVATQSVGSGRIKITNRVLASVLAMSVGFFSIHAGRICGGKVLS
jgi:hypothetical protein